MHPIEPPRVGYISHKFHNPELIILASDWSQCSFNAFL